MDDILFSLSHFPSFDFQRAAGISLAGAYFFHRLHYTASRRWWRSRPVLKPGRLERFGERVSFHRGEAPGQIAGRKDSVERKDSILGIPINQAPITG
jgi:hypothetical protein